MAPTNLQYSDNSLLCQPHRTFYKNLHVVLNQYLSFDVHVEEERYSIFSHKQNKQIRPILLVKDAKVLFHTLVTFRLNYFVILLTGLPKSFHELQMIQKTSTRILSHRGRTTRCFCVFADSGSPTLPEECLCALLLNSLFLPGTDSVEPPTARHQTYIFNL